MAKFVTFLIAINGLNVLGQVVNVAMAASESSGDILVIYIAYVVSFLSHIPTPILIVVFLKPV